MAKVKKDIGKGLSNMEKLEDILIDIATDLDSLKTAVETHTHTAVSTATTMEVNILTVKDN
jgi:hypothetical protein